MANKSVTLMWKSWIVRLAKNTTKYFSFCNEELILCKSASIPVERDMHEDNADLTKGIFVTRVSRDSNTDEKYKLYNFQADAEAIRDCTLKSNNLVAIGVQTH